MTNPRDWVQTTTLLLALGTFAIVALQSVRIEQLANEFRDRHGENAQEGA